jgi:hypothetical protein
VKWPLIASIMLVLMGCASRTQTAFDLDYSKGCHFRAEGLTLKEAAEIQSTWDFTDCEVNTTHEEGAKEK